MNGWPHLKGFMNFGCLEHSKIMFIFWTFFLVERHLTLFVRVRLMKFLWLTLFFWRNKIISLGNKRTALFQTHNWEKSSFFSTLIILVFSRLYANTWQGGHNVPPAGPNRVKIYFKLETRGTHLVEDKRVADSHHQKRHACKSDFSI